MSTGYERSRAGADWWSRWMALGSLVIAGGTLVWSFLQHDKHPTREQILGMIQERTTTYETQENQAREQREEAGRALLTSVRQESRDILDEHQRMVQELKTLKLTLQEQADADSTELTARTQGTNENGPEVNGMARDASAAPNTDAGTDADLAEQGPAADEAPAISPEAGSASVAAQARLTSERVALRPFTPAADHMDVPLWAVRNPSSQTVDIHTIEFQPEEVIDVGTPLSLGDIPETDLDHLRLVLTPEDNASSRPGYQGKYVKSLEYTYQLPANQARELRVVIDDASHAGYGMRGKLLLHYNSTEPLVIENYPVIFVASASEAAAEDQVPQ